MRAVTELRELSSIAYGFIASKALFAALGIDLFTHLAAGPRTTAELSHDTGIAAPATDAAARAVGGRPDRRRRALQPQRTRVPLDHRQRAHPGV